MFDNHEIITFSQAKIRKLKFYYTGIPCCNGHRTQRYTADKHCVECKRIKNRKYLIEEGYAREYYLENRKAILFNAKKRNSLKNNRKGISNA